MPLLTSNVRFHMIINIKRILALLIFISFFLPLSQCQMIEPNHESGIKDPNITTHKTISKSSIVTFNFFASFKAAEVGSWVALFAFAWPLILVALYILFNNKVLNYVELFEPLLCTVTIYFIGQVILIGHVLIGGYLWLVGMGGYFIVAVIISYGKLKLIIKNKSNKTVKQTG